MSEDIKAAIDFYGGNYKPKEEDSPKLSPEARKGFHNFCQKAGITPKSNEVKKKESTEE